MKIALDAGHGLNTPGKQTPDGIKEWTLNDKVRDKIVEKLKEYSVEIICTDNNEGNVDEGLSTRRKMYVNQNVDAFVSIHHNAFNGTWNDATGVEVYTDKNPTSKDTQLANAIYKNLPSYTGLKARGIKQANFTVINQNQVPAVLVEGGFMDSNNDYKVITSEAGQDAYARAVAEGLIEFLGLQKGQVTDEIQPKSDKKQTTNIGDTVSGTIVDIQSTLNARYGFKIAVDGIYGKETKKALVMALQIELNKQYNKGLAVDGIFGAKTKSACVSVRKGAKGNITYILQALLHCNGYFTNGVDGLFGAGTENAVIIYQKENGLTVDGIAGKNTFAKLSA